MMIFRRGTDGAPTHRAFRYLLGLGVPAIFSLAAMAQRAPIVPVDPWNATSPDCETIETLNPDGPLLDMVDWLTLDRDLRETSHLASEPAGTPGYVFGTTLTQDRMTYVKTGSGDTWDVNLIDDIGIWAWRTETHWNTPQDFTQFRHVGQALVAPRFARGGYPGMRWVNCDSAYSQHRSCGAPTHYGHLGYLIHELYGPYDYQPGWGEINGTIYKIVGWYGCATTSPDSCTTAEVTWLSRRYGQISWRQYDRKDGVMVLTASPPPLGYVVPGVIPVTFPCDEAMP